MTIERNKTWPFAQYFNCTIWLDTNDKLGWFLIIYCFLSGFLNIKADFICQFKVILFLSISLTVDLYWVEDFVFSHLATWSIYSLYCHRFTVLHEFLTSKNFEFLLVSKLVRMFWNVLNFDSFRSLLLLLPKPFINLVGAHTHLRRE